MQFIYDKNAKNELLKIEDENYNYIVKARRHKLDDILDFRNLEDDFLYSYKISQIDKKSLFLNLLKKEEKIIENSKKIHLAWCVVDPKTIYENIASLNELGVDKITFVYSDFSQKNFKINFEKLEKILINSSSQCGRSSIIKLDIYKNIDTFIKDNPDTYFLDFSQTSIDSKVLDIKTLMIGTEGGFSKRERELFNKNFIVGFSSNLILKSQTAIISATSKIIL
ncbi:16S rRNA (uracil(1498)-N(3))-methyltransferase [Aliarcobacter cryaerophilus]|jgi:16S rRNA (uracil1498-N3)-methyltransferase|uniref:Ribosomal RNA small subunit methyltransferase E n=1 Tax=Arcobacter sp. AZ-2023 TaxID=3074453 RepID=A0AA96DKU0_9BACT|nr:16S rRNA (uracil(1498)-N(3))-methyltransferase [Aliarcobacter cryaerophilus]WNL29684.1 16S rRNA (uracil(1498)-N(3))-methyltransferase [Arcobacter sp. AZ-2023]MCT7499066.1 16S rRNA (uracil(1498)-N(3))-methyltransferase [Aliarcobacter cryaerophilus]MCT7512214.1 16S rRNA (uracil(1498)-N(3))-methyltransferase [Aliarcobacter cryaerophilus]MCT7518769.1 16S rRNA (uracil(1498)-N(3))-methyltransferase [Aliarcobacter cryaerophilus]MCT7541553.1 16S rRNA (uracil(1498)-N(3))-methyltransferase [Aliarcoba